MQTHSAKRVAIEAKHLRPRLDRVSLRPDALGAYAAALAHRLTVVCAPAGYGKTTTTAAALDGCGHRAVWYKLDVLDRDPFAFLAAMTRAVRRLHPGFGEELLRELEAGPVLDAPPQALAATFCAECDRLVTEEGHIVLDDYHETMDAAAMNEILSYLLDNCPQTMRFVVLSRYEPAFRVEKLRLVGELARIPRDLLLFDAGQVADVLEQRSGRHHDPEHVRHLLALTEGWPASVVLAGMALAWLDVASLEVALGDPRLRGDVFSYLAEQVLQRQSDGVQRVLLRTCCLDYVTGELAERLLGDASASRHLHFLARNHVFTFDAGRRGAYRYHNLLRDFLRQRFVQEEGETAFRALQRETAVALEACGDRSAAIELLLGANELELALAAVARGGEGLLEGLPTEQLRVWASRLASYASDGRPWALVLSAVLDTRVGRFNEALANLHRAVTYISNPENGELYQVLSILEWAQFWAGDSSGSMETCYRALAHAKSDSERLHTLLSLLSSALDMRHWEAVEAASRESEKLLSHTHPGEVLRAQALRAHASYYQGDMYRACRLMAECRGPAPTAAQWATMLNTKGMIETALGDYDAAADSLTEAAAIADDFGHSLASHIEDNRAFLQACVGKADLALGHLRRLAKHDEPGDPTHKCIVLTHQGTVLRRIGDPRGALEPSELASQTVGVERDSYLALNAQSNLAFCQGLSGSDHQGVLSDLSAEAGRAGLPFVEHKALLFAGILAFRQGDRPRAVELLERCLPSQLTLGHINLVAQELCPRPELASLILRRHKANGLGPAFMKALSRHWQFPELSQTLRGLCQSQVGTWIDLVAAGDGTVAPPGSEKAVRPPLKGPSPLDELSPRERQVLALMADQRTNAEIARQLFITLATVKSHVNHILGKMGQTNRLGAVLEYQRLMHHSPPGDMTDNQPWV